LSSSGSTAGATAGSPVESAAESKARLARLGRSAAFGPELELAIDLAHQAGRIQMERYERLEDIRAKGPRDVVTEVDHLCEGLVMRAVQELYPSDSFYAEEIGEVASPSAAKSGRIWIVDPLDGTINYANGIPFFCISIALVAEGRPVVGVIHDPTRDETFTGAVDGPSLRNGHSVQVADKELLSDVVATLAIGGRGTVRKRREALKAVRAHRSMGSAALTLAYVACGRFDVYAQGAGLSAWDVAAAGLIAERAGATVTNLEGGPWFDLAYPAKKWSCLAASPRQHAAILAMLK
jgi:myo-inositol-1(or 4)-monophosphatase